MDITIFYNQFQWFISLGYVTVIATILTMLVVQLMKVTVFKKKLASYKLVINSLTSTDVERTSAASSIDKMLSLTGTILSLVIFAICHFANEMILQKTFFIDFQVATQSVSIVSGAAVTWVAAKGLYTVIHKFVERIKDKKLSMKDLSDTIKDIDEVAQAVAAEKANPTTTSTLIGNVASQVGVKKVSLQEVKGESAKSSVKKSK